MPSAPQTFHEMLHQARVEAEQSVDAMAVLLALTPEQYQGLEQGGYPDDETLTKLCKMMEWNYYEAQRLIINEMISPHPNLRHQSGAPPAVPADKSPKREPPPPLRSDFKRDTLGSRLQNAREESGQSAKIIALLLHIDAEVYERLESGEPPADDLLRRICVVYNWNYNELQDLLRAQQAGSFHPALSAPLLPTTTAHLGQYRGLTQEMDKLFGKLAPDDQKSVVAQMELVRDSMRRHQRHGP